MTPSTQLQHHNPPPLTVGEVLSFRQEHVHTIQQHAGAASSPALRLSSDKELIPSSVKKGHIVFLKDYHEGSSSCTITDAHKRFSRAACNNHINQINQGASNGLPSTQT